MDNTISKCTKIKLISVTDLLMDGYVREMKKFMPKFFSKIYFNNICVCMHIYVWTVHMSTGSQKRQNGTSD